MQQYRGPVSTETEAKMRAGQRRRREREANLKGIEWSGSMFVEIRATTSLVWEIDYATPEGKREALLEMDGGEWYLTSSPQAGKQSLGAARLSWPEALKRALVTLSPNSY